MHFLLISYWIADDFQTKLMFGSSQTNIYFLFNEELFFWKIILCDANFGRYLSFFLVVTSLFSIYFECICCLNKEHLLSKWKNNSRTDVRVSSSTWAFSQVKTGRKWNVHFLLVIGCCLELRSFSCLDDLLTFGYTFGLCSYSLSRNIFS